MKRFALILLAVLAAWILFEWIRFPDVEELATKNPETTAFMERRKEELRDEGKSDELQFRFVRYEKISPFLRRAVLVSEDNSFYEHEGVDTKALREALERDWRNRKLSHGGSTITQQLAKNLYLSPSKNPVRKLREFLIARQLEEKLSKKRILELYLNVVEMGERVYGAEAAARHYFGKSASSLSPSQAALLAASLPNPRVMKPDAPNQRLRARQRIILSRMRRWGYLVEREALRERKKQKEEPLSSETATETSSDPGSGTSASTMEETGTAPDETTTDGETTTIEQAPPEDAPPAVGDRPPSPETPATGSVPPPGR
jgi:monofunctional glycosyltransferase